MASERVPPDLEKVPEEGTTVKVQFGEFCTTVSVFVRPFTVRVKCPERGTVPVLASTVKLYWAVVLVLLPLELVMWIQGTSELIFHEQPLADVKKRVSVND